MAVLRERAQAFLATAPFKKLNNMKQVSRGIGLVAHDAMKKDLIEWVLWNSELLMGHKFYCTGTTVR